MDRILLVVTIAFLYSSTSLATDEDRSSRGVQYTQVTYHENGFDGAKPTVWMGKYGQLTNEDMTFRKRSVDDLLDLRGSAPGTGIGMGVAPLFGSYGVFRTSSNPDKPTYVVLGFTSDELTMDEAGTLDSRENRGFSYGFGVNNSSFSFEYMMSVDEENYNVSAIGLGFISEF